MPRKLWKQIEADLAALFGTKRIGPTGVHGPDFETEWLCVEVKERKALPEWLVEAMVQIQKCTPATKLPVVILHQKYMTHTCDLVVMTLADFQDWFGEIKKKEET